MPSGKDKLKGEQRAVAVPHRRASLRRESPAKDRSQISVTVRDKRAGKWFEKLVALQARLYGPSGCPWDREQTHQSLRKYLMEETYEVLDAMESPDPRKLCGELGDLLLQVVFHAILAEESGRFTISDVVESVHSKMVRRHPHVFGEATADSSAAVLKNWEQIKAQERVAERITTDDGKPSEAESTESILDGVPGSLPALLEAYQFTRRASHVGFDWNSLKEILDKLDEEKGEILEVVSVRSPDGNATVDPKSLSRLEEEIGDLLFTAVNVARFSNVDPEIALKKANRKFKQRFKSMESTAALDGKRLSDVSRDRMEQLWNASKAK